MTASVIDGPSEVKDATHGFAGGGGVAKQIDITGKVPGEFYVLNSSAEEVLKFNKKAPIKELLTFFKRHSWDVVGDAVESALTSDRPLIWLDWTNANAVVALTTAGIDASTDPRRDDYQLLKGVVPEYQFIRNTYSGVDHLTQVAYSAGAVVGDAAIKTTMVYVSNKMTESTTVPHVLETDDLVTP
jgi:hypothetical protein